jgi:predicted ATP-grasp superfamily ATP-dependent carboligase
MHIFVYEWVSGGGLLGLEGAMPESLLREGMTMARAVGEDLAKLPIARVTLLRDVRVMDLSAPGCELIGVDSPCQRNELLEEQFRSADAVLLIAPETDGHLLRLVREAESLGAKLFSPGSDFVRVASDKATTADRLAAAGVPTPEGITLESEESLPNHFQYPAVLKPLDGAGSEDTYLVSGPNDSPPAYAWPRRLERYHHGMAASVSVLLAGAEATALMPCQQRLSTDGRLRYLGGRAPLAEGLASRAARLALQAAAAMPPTVGYVGVDLVLGATPTGAQDVVIEINPRLTTSYTGLRAATSTNLAGAMLACREGRATVIDFNATPIEFDADGIVSFI